MEAQSCAAYDIAVGDRLQPQSRMHYKAREKVRGARAKIRNEEQQEISLNREVGIGLTKREVFQRRLEGGEGRS